MIGQDGSAILKRFEDRGLETSGLQDLLAHSVLRSLTSGSSVAAFVCLEASYPTTVLGLHPVTDRTVQMCGLVASFDAAFERT